MIFYDDITLYIYIHINYRYNLFDLLPGWQKTRNLEKRIALDQYPHPATVHPSETLWSQVVVLMIDDVVGGWWNTCCFS